LVLMVPHRGTQILPATPYRVVVVPGSFQFIGRSYIVYFYEIFHSTCFFGLYST
jgi:hypothetical protein